MTEPPVLALLVTAALTCSVVAGVFFAFSSFVMSALARLPPEQGAAAMNAINVTVINPVFMLVFAGTAVLCLILAGGSLFWWPHSAGQLALLASALYLVGSLGVTMAFNVPLNNQLAAVQPAQLAATWSRYQRMWTFWNHIRMLASIGAALLFMGAALMR
jgi:uncharacterized membrane protein